MTKLLAAAIIAVLLLLLPGAIQIKLAPPEITWCVAVRTGLSVLPNRVCLSTHLTFRWN
ncbi:MULTISPECIES: hypothetical protein [Rhodomicrobium]|uniref:hypothetical protein n=1 Tax=Rhodomicrobium TaxID=1068 RepID=UPI00148272F1|nr:MULTISPECIES: hypothetical protein [Rhodomicrobium]